MGIVILVATIFVKGWNKSSSDTVLISNQDTSSPLPLSSAPFEELGGMSQDKSLTLIVKNYPNKDVCDDGGYICIKNNEIWIKNNNTGNENLLVKSGDISEYPFANSDNFPFSSIYNLKSPIFSLDNNKVYFMSSAWTTSDAIFSVDISTGKLKLISDGNSLEVVRIGSDKGNLKVLKHKYYNPPDYGSYDHYYVITDSGKEIKDLGGISHINGEEIIDK